MGNDDLSHAGSGLSIVALKSLVFQIATPSVDELGVSNKIRLGVEPIAVSPMAVAAIAAKIVFMIGIWTKITILRQKFVILAHKYYFSSIMENFHDLLIRRHSIRRYTDEPVSPDHVRLILEAALLAPTSKNSRCWHFVAVDDKSTLLRLAECKPAGQVPLKNCVLAIVVAADSTRSDAWIEDASLAAEFMQLQAEALGIGSCWVQVRGRFTADGTPSEEVVQEILGIPDTISIECIMTFGHKDEERRPVDTSKLLWEKVHIGKWNPTQED